VPKSNPTTIYVIQFFFGTLPSPHAPQILSTTVPTEPNGAAPARKSKVAASARESQGMVAIKDENKNENPRPNCFVFYILPDRFQFSRNNSNPVRNSKNNSKTERNSE
jgi:hypothetical protein